MGAQKQGRTIFSSFFLVIFCGQRLFGNPVLLGEKLTITEPPKLARESDAIFSYFQMMVRLVSQLTVFVFFYSFNNIHHPWFPVTLLDRDFVALAGQYFSLLSNTMNVVFQTEDMIEYDHLSLERSILHALYEDIIRAYCIFQKRQPTSLRHCLRTRPPTGALILPVPWVFSRYKIMDRINTFVFLSNGSIKKMDSESS